MATGADLAILLKLRDEATAAMKKAQGSLDALEGSAKKGQGAFSALSTAMSRAEDSSKKLAMGVGLVAVAVAGIGLKGLQVAGDMEQVRVAFNTMLGSAEAGGRMVKDLWQFAATTPFEFTGLVSNARLLKAMGFEAQAIIPTMTAVGEAVSALGGGEFEIQRVARALGQMQAKGKVAAQEMTLQLSEVGIPAWKYLAEAIGTTVPEAMKRVEQGTISSAVGIKAVLAGMTKDFKGGMAAQMNTLLGIWSNTKDQITGLLWAIGDTIVTTFDVRERLKNFNNGLTQIASTFRDFADLVAARGLDRALDLTFSNDRKIVILAMAGAITGMLTPAFISLGMAIWGALAPLIPFMAAGTAVAGLGALVWQNWDKVPPIFDETNAGLAVAYNEMNRVSESGAKLTDMQRDMIRALIDIDPKFKTLKDQLAGMNEEQLASILSSAKLGLEIKKTAGATQQGTPPLEEYGKAAEIAMMKVRDLAEAIKGAGRTINDMAVNISDLKGRLYDMENPLNIQLLTIDQLKQKVAVWGDEMVVSKNAAKRLADEAAAALLIYNQKYAEMLALQESGAVLTQEQWQAIRDSVDDARDATADAYSIAQRGAETYAQAQDRVNAGLDEWNQRAGEEATTALEKQAAAIEAVRLRVEAWNEQVDRNNNLLGMIGGRMQDQLAAKLKITADATEAWNVKVAENNRLQEEAIAIARRSVLAGVGAEGEQAWQMVAGRVSGGMSWADAVAAVRRDQPGLGKGLDIITTGEGLPMSPFTPGGQAGGRIRVPGFQHGGIVPGPAGQPRLVVAHGGEPIIPGAKFDAMIELLQIIAGKPVIDGPGFAQSVSAYMQSRSSSLSRMGA